MKKVRCVVDFKDKRKERTEAFQRLVLLLMLLRVFDAVEFVDEDTGAVRTMALDWDHAYEKARQRYNK